MMMSKEQNEESLFSGLTFSGLSESGDIQFDEKVKEEEPEPEDKKKPEETVEEEYEPTVEEEDEQASVQDEEDDEAPSDESDKEKSSSSSSYKVLAKALSEEGVLSLSDDEFENLDLDDAEEFIELFQKEINGRVDDYRSKIPDEIKTLLEGYENGLELEDLLAVKREQLDYSKITDEQLEDNEDLRRKLITADLKQRGFSDDEVKEEVDDIFALGKDDKRASRALDKIKGRIAKKEQDMIAEANQRTQEQQEEHKKRIENLKKNIDETKEFGGVKLTKKMRDDVFKALTKPIADINGVPVNRIVKSREEDPMTFEKNVATAFVLTNGFKDWSAFKKASKSSALKDLSKIAEQKSREKQFSNIKSSQEFSSDLEGFDLNNIVES